MRTYIAAVHIVDPQLISCSAKIRLDWAIKGPAESINYFGISYLINNNVHNYQANAETRLGF